MLKVGLTGGIGSGKSRVAREFRNLGRPTLDLDEVSRQVMAPGATAFLPIIQEFGPAILDKNGALDRSALGRLVFSDPDARRRLEAIVHPAVLEQAERWFEAQVESGARLAILEVPLLIEAGLEPMFDRIVLVTAPLEMRLERLKERGLSEADARSRIAAQWPDELKRQRSDIVIENAGSPEALSQAVRDASQRLSQFSGESSSA